jgi:prepilin-type N-terminal cleavage/methylation domain-containing protein
MLTPGPVRKDASRRKRSGFTIAELLIVLALGAIVLGLASSVGVRLERHLSAESTRLVSAEQLGAAMEFLPLDLRGLTPGAGDIAAGAARDTALEIRATIASALVCAATTSTITLAFHRGPGGRSPLLRAQSGDTLWLLTDADSGERWHPSPIVAVRHSVGSCATARTGADQVYDVSHPWAVDVHDSLASSPPLVARITRPERVSFYAASDGRWYLGLRTWNSATGQFAGIQPVSGPYRSPTAPGGSRFRYFDGAGAPIASGTVDPSRIARIEAMLATDPSPIVPGASPDSVAIVVALRNRDE